MPKINIYLPDDLADAVRESGIPVSAICQRALEQAVRRVADIRRTMLNGLEGDEATAQAALFTSRARTTLRLAMEQAASEGAPSVGTEHLLHGILAEGGNLALQVLRALEIEPAQIARDLSRHTAAAGPGEHRGEDSGRTDPDRAAEEAARTSGSGPLFGSEAAVALESAMAEANTLGHNYLGCEHVLLGLIAEPEGPAGQVLRALGAEARLTRRAVAAALAGYVHLKAQTGAASGGAGQAIPDGAAQALAAAVREEVRPLAERIGRIEERLDGPSAG